MSIPPFASSLTIRSTPRKSCIALREKRAFYRRRLENIPTGGELVGDIEAATAILEHLAPLKVRLDEQD